MTTSVVADLDDDLAQRNGHVDATEDRAAIQLQVKQKIGLVSRQWTARAARLFKTSGYTNAQRAPLYLLREAPQGLTQSELAARLQLSEPTLSRRIARLMEDGLVSKHRLVGDGRANLIKLETRGRQALEGAEATASQDRNLLFHGLSDEDLSVALRVLNILAVRVSGPVEKAHEPDPHVEI